MLEMDDFKQLSIVLLRLIISESRKLASLWYTGRKGHGCHNVWVSILMWIEMRVMDSYFSHMTNHFVRHLHLTNIMFLG